MVPESWVQTPVQNPALADQVERRLRYLSMFVRVPGPVILPVQWRYVMGMLNTNGIDRFVDSFDTKVTVDEVLLDNLGVAVITALGNVQIFGVFEKYNLFIESGPGVNGDEVFECCFAYAHNEDSVYPAGLFKVATDLDVELSTDTLFKHLWLLGPSIENITRVVMHPQFPQNVVPVKP